MHSFISFLNVFQTFIISNLSFLLFQLKKEETKTVLIIKSFNKKRLKKQKHSASNRIHNNHEISILTQLCHRL